MMDMSSDSMSSSTSMSTIFTTSQSTPLYSNAWTPRTTGQYAGTCIFLILLGTTLRSLLAAKHMLELRWSAQARNRRYVVVQGRTPESSVIENDPNAKEGSLITAQGVEERIKVIQSAKQPTIPFRLSVDIPRACMTAAIVGLGYLAMIAAVCSLSPL